MTNQMLTPALIIDGDILRRNLQRMADYAAKHRLNLRPHTKTHKSQLIAKLQVELGAPGLTVAKAGEAGVMAACTDDLLMAYPPVDKTRCDALAYLAATKPNRQIRVAIDSSHAIECFAASSFADKVTIGVLVELDVGLHRTGVQSPEDVFDLAQQIDATPGLRFDGLMFYPGQFRSTPTADDPELHRVNGLLDRTVELLTKAGLPPAIVSGGSTPTAPATHLFHHITEFRPGTYVYNDINSVIAGVATHDDCAARIRATVISNAVPGQVVIDAGSKSLTTEKPNPDASHGYIVDYPDAKITSLKEEHGMIDVSACDKSPGVGEQINIIPNHICPCVNLQNEAWLVNGDNPPEPFTIDARGRLF
ncbi:MAG: alanine racemase [Planctomycetota bacterium]|jgi:D-serine deaminase-like pyridoxal phosphate-dependent protein